MSHDVSTLSRVRHKVIAGIFFNLVYHVTSVVGRCTLLNADNFISSPDLR